MKLEKIIPVLILIGFAFSSGCINNGDEEKDQNRIFYLIDLSAEETAEYSISLPWGEDLSVLSDNIEEHSGNFSYSFVSQDNSSFLKLEGKGNIVLRFYKLFDILPNIQLSMINEENNSINLSVDVDPPGSELYLYWTMQMYDDDMERNWGYEIESRLKNGNQVVAVQEIDFSPSDYFEF